MVSTLELENPTEQTGLMIDVNKLDHYDLHHAQKIIMPFHELEKIEEIKEGLSSRRLFFKPIKSKISFTLIRALALSPFSLFFVFTSNISY